MGPQLSAASLGLAQRCLAVKRFKRGLEKSLGTFVGGVRGGAFAQPQSILGLAGLGFWTSIDLPRCALEIKVCVARVQYIQNLGSTLNVIIHRLSLLTTSPCYSRFRSVEKVVRD